MKVIAADVVARAAPYRDIVEALRQAFRENYTTPVRHHHDLSPTAILLLMPAWSQRYSGLKTVMFKTDNAEKGLPTIQASYLLFDNATGETLAVIDGTELTRRRTAAASALAADYLARADSTVMALIGAGALAPHFVRAHASVRPIKELRIFSRTPEKSEALARMLAGDGLSIRVTAEPEQAVRDADIVSCITTSTVPIVKGQWLKPGTHVDLAGAFKPPMRETDGDTVARARVYVDTREGAMAEAGDLLQARDEGKFLMEDIRGDLFDLCRGKVAGRQSEEDITLFKSCGTAIEDLATAIMIHERS
jgi:ornithine cyclodeaminase/alanine dehydrogenase-like protein (mu-crystallin family)